MSNEEQSLEDFRAKLEEMLSQMSDDEVVDLYNIYAENTVSIPIFYIWEASKFGFRPNDRNMGEGSSFFIITDTAAPRAFGKLSDPFSPFDKDKLIDAICENPKAYGFEEI